MFGIGLDRFLVHQCRFTHVAQMFGRLAGQIARLRVVGVQLQGVTEFQPSLRIVVSSEIVLAFGHVAVLARRRAAAADQQRGNRQYGKTLDAQRN